MGLWRRCVRTALLTISLLKCYANTMKTVVKCQDERTLADERDRLTVEDEEDEDHDAARHLSPPLLVARNPFALITVRCRYAAATTERPAESHPREHARMKLETRGRRRRSAPQSRCMLDRFGRADPSRPRPRWPLLPRVLLFALCRLSLPSRRRRGGRVDRDETSVDVDEAFADWTGGIGSHAEPFVHAIPAG